MVLATPGHTVTITAKLVNGSPFALRIAGDWLQTPDEWGRKPEFHSESHTLAPGSSFVSNFQRHRARRRRIYTSILASRRSREGKRQHRGRSALRDAAVSAAAFSRRVFVSSSRMERRVRARESATGTIQDSAAAVVMTTIRDGESGNEPAALAGRPGVLRHARTGRTGHSGRERLRDQREGRREQRCCGPAQRDAAS